MRPFLLQFVVLLLPCVAHAQCSGSFQDAVDAMDPATMTSLRCASGPGFTGTFPADVGLLTNLVELEIFGDSDAAVNSTIISGTIPEQLSALTLLESLVLQYQDLEGSLPEALSALSLLTTVQIVDCGIDGTLPAAVIDSWNVLEKLDVSMNALQGPLPALSGLGAVTELKMNDNQINGPLPSISALSNLNTLSLSGNAFTSSIPDAYGSATQLEILTLSDNALTGTVPSSLSALTGLASLLLSGNENLEPPFPDFIMNVGENDYDVLVPPTPPSGAAALGAYVTLVVANIILCT